MKGYVTGIVSGLLISSGFYIPLLLNEQKNKYESGKHQGFINGQREILDTLLSEYGNVPSDMKVKILFSVKTDDAVSYEINGVKTIGIRK